MQCPGQRAGRQGGKQEQKADALSSGRGGVAPGSGVLSLGGICTGPAVRDGGHRLRKNRGPLALKSEGPLSSVLMCFKTGLCNLGVF